MSLRATSKREKLAALERCYARFLDALLDYLSAGPGVREVHWERVSRIVPVLVDRLLDVLNAERGE